MSNKKYYSAICLIIRDENEYLNEWLDNHLKLGINHIFIYDNGAEVAPVGRIIRQLPKEEQSKITIIDWIDEYKHTQHEAYNHCLNNFGIYCSWIGFIDADELLRITDQTSNINELLKDYENYGAFRISWKEYNANGKVMKENLPLRERFITPAPNFPPYYGKIGLGKVFVQPTQTLYMFIHHAQLKEGSVTCNEEYETLINDVFRAKYCDKRIVLDHYYTKSYEEWCSKINRGSADPNYQRRYEEFFAYNPDLRYIYNDHMQQNQKYNKN